MSTIGDEQTRALASAFRGISELVGKPTGDSIAMLAILHRLFDDLQDEDAALEAALRQRQRIWSLPENRSGARNALDVERDALRAIASEIAAMRFAGTC